MILDHAAARYINRIEVFSDRNLPRSASFFFRKHGKSRPNRTDRVSSAAYGMAYRDGLNQRSFSVGCFGGKG